MALTVLERRALHSYPYAQDAIADDSINFTYDPALDTAYWGHALTEVVTIPNTGSGSGSLNPIVDLTTAVFRGVECGGPWGASRVDDDRGNLRVVHLWVFQRNGEIVVAVLLTNEWYEIFSNYGQSNEFQKWTARPTTTVLYRFDQATGAHVATYETETALDVNSNFTGSNEATVEYVADSGTCNMLGHKTYQTILDPPDNLALEPRYIAVTLTLGPGAWLPTKTAIGVDNGYVGATNPYHYYEEVNGSYGLALDPYPLDDPFDGDNIGEWDDPGNVLCAVYDRSDSTRLELAPQDVLWQYLGEIRLSHYQGSRLMAVLFAGRSDQQTALYEYVLIGADGAQPPSVPLWSGDWGGDWVPAYGYPPGVTSFPIAYPELVDGRVVIVNPEDPTDPWTWVTLPPGAPPNGFLSWWLDGDVWRISYNGVMILAWQVPADKYALWLQNGAAGGFFNTQSKVFRLDPPAGVPPWVPSGFPIDGSGRYRVDTTTWEPETGDSLTEHGIRYRGFDVLLFDDRAEVGELFQDRYILSANRAYRFARGTEPFLVDASEAQMIYEAGYGWSCYPVPGGE